MRLFYLEVITASTVNKRYQVRYNKNTWRKMYLEETEGGLKVDVTTSVAAQQLLSKKDEWIHTFWWRHRFVLAVFIFALLADVLTTVSFMIKDGVESEFNPFVVVCARYMGPVVGPLAAALHKGWSAILIAIYCEKYARTLFTSAASIYLLAACYNMWAVELCVRGIISYRWLVI